MVPLQAVNYGFSEAVVRKLDWRYFQRNRDLPEAAALPVRGLSAYFVEDPRPERYFIRPFSSAMK